METNSTQGTSAPITPTFASPAQELGRDDFLKLLVAKLANQDPLSPTQDSEFVAELATFSSLEQLVEANQRLDNLAFGQSELINAQTLELIGKRALVESDGTFQVRNGIADQLVYEVPRPARDVELILRDEQGEIVRNVNLEPDPQGRVTLDLNGGGRQKALPDGKYTIEVKASDVSGQPMQIALFRLLPIDGVNFTDGLIRLVSGDRILNFQQILEIHDGQKASSAL